MKNTFKHLVKHISFKSLLVIAMISLAACNSKEKSETTNNDSSVEVNNKDVVTLTETQFASGSMELGKITTQPFNTVVKANGMFAVPPQNQADVSAYFAGYVKNISLLPGDVVEKGQTLFTIENPEYVQLQQDFLEAKGRLNYLKSDYERQKELMVDNVTSKKNFLKKLNRNIP